MRNGIMEILSLEDLNTLKEKLAEFNGEVLRFYEQYDNAIKAFETNETVKSLFSSGNYGETLKLKLQDIRKLMQKYFQSISDGSGSLVGQTNKYISEQLDLQMQISRGYTASDSVHERRVGNQQ